ncbi:hypothetical protein MUSASHINO07_12130 [Gemella sp. Musashino-2025]
MKKRPPITAFDEEYTCMGLFDLLRIVEINFIIPWMSIVTRTIAIWVLKQV